MKRIILSTLAALGVAVCAGAATQQSYLEVKDMAVEKHGEMLSINIEIDPADIAPGRDREVVFTPVLRSEITDDSLELRPVVIAGRNRYLMAERHGFVKAGNPIYRAGNKEAVSISALVPFEPWMMRSELSMRQQTRNCCDPTVTRPDELLARLDYTERPFEPALPYIALTGDSIVELTAEGRAYVDFVVNRTEIRPDYRRNRVEIARIIESIDRVRNDSMATITAITIKGFASPEGPYSNNVRLAVGRTESLKEYVRSHYNFDSSIMSSDYEPEDWAGLRAWVEQCTLPHRAEILDLIDSGMEPDAKDHTIRARYPRDYAVMLDSVYPGLRHSDYTVRYSIRTTIDVEQLKATMATAPERLRPVDFYLVAQSYPEGSEEYEAALMKAVEMYPNDAEANINAANISMRHGNLENAARYADRAGDRPEAMYTRAALAARNGDRDRTRVLMEAAAAAGYEPAVQCVEELRQMEQTPRVTYFKK